MKRSSFILILLLACIVGMAMAAAGSPAGTPVLSGSAVASPDRQIPLIGADGEIATETTEIPTFVPVTYPTEEPTTVRTTEPTPVPTEIPTVYPTTEVTTEIPTVYPTTEVPTGYPTVYPTTEVPTGYPSVYPTTEEQRPLPGQLAPVADFSASPLSGDSPLTVRFTDTSLNSPTMWYWSFGDGSSEGFSGAPSHSYASPGSYTVTLTATNQYGSDTITKSDYVTVNGAVMDTGSIYAQSFPQGATIYVNGKSYGSSPVTIPDLFPGTYAVMASLNGYYPDTQTVTVYGKQTAGYYPTLRASPSPPVMTGSISAATTPAGASLYVNGIRYGNTPVTVNNLVPGTYSVAAGLNGYRSHTQLVTVNPGQESRYYADLQPSPNPGPAGAIYAQSSPAGAAIYVDNQLYGNAPVTIPNLAPATYTVKATLAGYPAVTQRITVSPGRTVFFSPVFYPSPPPIGSGSGIIAVYSNVEGAKVSFDNIPQGSIANGVLYVTVAVTGTPYKTYRVEAPGYVTQNGVIGRWPANGETVSIATTLVPQGAPTSPTRAPLPAMLPAGAVAAAGVLAAVAGRKRNR